MLSGVGTWGCLLWNIGRLLGVSVYLSYQRSSRSGLAFRSGFAFGSGLTFGFPGSHTEFVKRLTEILETWKEMAVNDFDDMSLEI